MFLKTRAEFGDLTLLFCSEQQRNVQSFITHVQNHGTVITTFCAFDLIMCDTYDSRENGMLFSLSSSFGASVPCYAHVEYLIFSLIGALARRTLECRRRFEA